MKGITNWNHTPYKPLNASALCREFFICQLQPYSNGFSAAYRDSLPGSHTLLYRIRGKDEWQEIPAENSPVRVTGLQDDTDYEIMIRRNGTGETTLIRLLRTGDPIGTVINYLHPEDTVYAFSGHCLCSPSIVKLPSGRLIVSNDIYAAQQAQNLTLLFESCDNGETWQYLTELYPCFWGKLFLHKGRLYMLGMACEYGDLLIGVSDDEGRTWSAPVHLFNGTNAREIGPHKAPMPVASYNGMLCTAIDYGSWKYNGHESCILSINENDDLLCPENWHLTEPLPFDLSWQGLPKGPMKGCLEGNAVVSPSGELLNILRLQQNDAVPNGGKAVALKFTDKDSPLEFERVLDFPLGANSKFVILQAGSLYIAVGNEYFSKKMPKARTILSAAVSKDLIHWQIAERIVDVRDKDCASVAFQYPDAMLDGNDLLVVSRTAMNGAENFHNNNMITFHRLSGFIDQVVHN